MYWRTPSINPRHKMRILKSGFAVAEREAGKVVHAAACGAQHGMAGRGVPFHGAAKAWLQVGLAAGEQAQFKR